MIQNNTNVSTTTKCEQTISFQIPSLNNFLYHDMGIAVGKLVEN